jgi:lysophospholipase L1-like esterase
MMQGGVDYNAKLYLQASLNNSDAIISSRINSLVVNLKKYGLFNKIKALWPLEGSTVAKHTFNLINPSTFNLTFVGSGTHDGLGYTGASGVYAITGLIPADTLVKNSSTLFAFSCSNTKNSGVAIGCRGPSPYNALRIYLKDTTNAMYNSVNDTYAGGAQIVENADGLHIVSRINGYGFSVFRNTFPYFILSRASTSTPLVELYLSSQNNNGSQNSSDNRKYAMYGVADGLTGVEIKILAKIINEYITEKGYTCSSISNPTIFYGDSITIGSGASIPAKRWTSLVSVDQGYYEYNLGVAGSQLQDTLPLALVPGCMIADMALGNYTDEHMLFMAYGTNDVRNQYTTNEIFYTQYNKVLNDLINIKGWPTNKIKLISSFHISNFLYGNIAKQNSIDATINSLANTYGIQYFNARQAMIDGGGDALLNVDGVHPTDVGYQVIADYINLNL